MSELMNTAPASAAKKEMRRQAKVTRSGAFARHGGAASEAIARHGIAFAGRPAPAVVSAPSPAATQPEQALHRVRVGVFTDRAASVAAARELESKGFRPYIARGDQ